MHSQNNFETPLAAVVVSKIASPVVTVHVQVERFLDTENAALISMHYPQAQREVHFGTAPFHRGEDEEGADAEGLDGGEGGEESVGMDTGAAGARREGERVPEDMLVISSRVLALRNGCVQSTSQVCRCFRVALRVFSVSVSHLR